MKLRRYSLAGLVVSGILFLLWIPGAFQSEVMFASGLLMFGAAAGALFIRSLNAPVGLGRGAAVALGGALCGAGVFSLLFGGSTSMASALGSLIGSFGIGGLLLWIGFKQPRGVPDEELAEAVQVLEAESTGVEEGGDLVAPATPECADCSATLSWNTAFRSQTTPGFSEISVHHDDFLPRVFCPACGALVAQWHITADRDYEEWSWFGRNEQVNSGRELPPSPLTHSGVTFPPEYLPSFATHRLDVEAIRASGTMSAATFDPEVLAVVMRVAKAAGEDAESMSIDWALFFAAKHGFASDVEFLLGKGADPDFTSPTGWTPLLMAASEGHVQATNALLRGGAKPNNQHCFAEHTPLILAALNDHTDVARVLIEAGADPSLKNQWGHTALEHATKAGNEELLKLLERPEPVLV